MFEPQSEKLTPEEKKNIIGVQGCIWTEWTKDSVKMEWQMMPRIAALSELQWCNPERKDLNGFLKRLRHQMDLYELYGYHYKEDIEDVTISVKPKGQDGIAVVELNTFDNASVYYTLDGSEPTSESLRYTEPFMINRTTTIKARAIRNGRESNVTEETLTYNLATMHSITCKLDKKVKEYDFNYAIHLHGPDMPLYPDADDVWENVKDLDPRIGMCLDIGHDRRNGKDPVADLEKYISRVFDIHLKDVTGASKAGYSVEVGRGILDIPGFVRMLRKTGYDGVVSLEHERNMKDPFIGIAESIGYFRGVVATTSDRQK